jgi:hypothetical protein
VLTCSYHWIELTDHNGALSNGPELASNQLVHKMAENIIVLLLSFGFLNGELQLALYLPHEEIVDHDVVSWIVQLVLDSYQFEFTTHALTVIQ